MHQNPLLSTSRNFPKTSERLAVSRVKNYLSKFQDFDSNCFIVIVFNTYIILRLKNILTKDITSDLGHYHHINVYAVQQYMGGFQNAMEGGTQGCYCQISTLNGLHSIAITKIRLFKVLFVY